MAKTIEVAKQIIEEMSSNFRWRDKKNTMKGGKYEVDALLAIQNSVHTLARRMDQLSAGNTLKACEVCGIQGHSLSECATAESSLRQQVNAVYNQGKLPFNPYSNTYNEGWRHHPNFSYENPNASLNPPSYHQPPPNNQQPQGFQRPPP